jgi:signal transduction histidine kinase
LVSNDDDLFWRADGTPLPVATATQPMIDQGRIVGAVVSFVDMRQRKALDAARDHALHEAERLARVRSEFLANMSHEIRTPLNGVLGMAHIGYRHSGGTGKTGDAFAKIIQSGQLLLGIINDILDFSKIEAGKFKIESVPVELVAVMRDAVNVMHERAQAKGLNLRVKKGKDFPAFCLGDPLRLSQILVNLLSNAIKFTERGSVTLSATHTGGQLVFKVIDTGIGMTLEQIDRLYQPFEQADGSTTRRYGGTGLGLSITLRLLELMGGEIRVESVPGEGSTFEVRLPFVPANPPEVAEVPAEQSAARDGLPLQGLTILVAEDNPVNQEVIKATLLGEGAEVVMAENGLEAVACVERGDTFDMVLMDIQMPVMGGFEATRRIREIAPDLPIIGQTANAFAEDRKACLEAGMVDHIAKPIDVQALIESIRRHVSGK